MGILKIVTKVLGSSVFRNIKSKVGGMGNINRDSIGGDMVYDLIKLLIIASLIVYAIKTGDWETAEKGKDFIQN